MKRLLPLGLGLALCLSAAAQEEGGEGWKSDPAGVWIRTSGETRIEIAPCGEDLCAVNQWVRDPDSAEKPGDVLVMSLKPTAPGRFEGEAYDKRRDRRYAMTLTLTPDGMRTEGCVLMGLICRCADWRKLEGISR